MFEEKTLLKVLALTAVGAGLRVKRQDSGRFKKTIISRSFNKLSSPEDYFLLLSGKSEKNESERKELVSLLVVGESFFSRGKGRFAP